MIWTHMIVQTSSITFTYVVALVGILVDMHGLRKEVHHRNYVNKAKLAM